MGTGGGPGGVFRLSQAWAHGRPASCPVGEPSKQTTRTSTEEMLKGNEAKGLDRETVKGHSHCIMASGPGGSLAGAHDPSPTGRERCQSVFIGHCHTLKERVCSIT